MKNPKEVLNEIFSSSGDDYHARFLSQLPRGPRDICNARAAAKNVFKSSTWNGSVKEQNEVWVILEKAKKEKMEFSDLKFIRDFTVHPNFPVDLS